MFQNRRKITTAFILMKTYPEDNLFSDFCQFWWN